MKNISRRDFIKVSCYSLVGSNLLFFSKPSNAILPFIARFLLGRVAKSALKSAAKKAGKRAVRGSSKTLSRASRNPTPRKIFPNFKSALDLGSIAVGIASLSPKVYADVKDYDCEAIWINSGQENDFILQVANSTDTRKHCSISYQIIDVKSGYIEMEEGLGTVSVEPFEDFVFPFEVSDLPFEGVKRLQGFSDSDTLTIEPSANIMVASPDEVQLAY